MDTVPRQIAFGILRWVEVRLEETLYKEPNVVAIRVQR